MNRRLPLAAAALLVVAGVCLCVVLISNAPQAPVEEMSSYYEGPSNYVRAPSLSKLAGHDSNPNDDSLRLHLLSRFMQHRLEQDPPRKEQLNGLWQRLAYARKVLGSKANEILGPKKRDRYGEMVKQQSQQQQHQEHQEERRANDDSFSDHLKSSSRRRELNRLRRFLKNKYHLADKHQALNIAEENAERQDEEARRNNRDNNHYAYRRGQQENENESENARGVDMDKSSFVGHPNAARALEEAFDDHETEENNAERRLRQARSSSSLVDVSPSSSSKIQNQYVSDANSQKLVIEGGPIPSSGPVAVVGWLHRDQDGDWAGKLFPKASREGLAAVKSPYAGGKGWFDGTIEATQLQQQQQKPVQAPPAPAPAAVSPAPVMAAAAPQQPEIVEEAPTLTSEYSQPYYDVVPQQYSQAVLDPQVSPTINEFEIEPGFQVQ